jgi:hypothetical protein
LKTWQQTIIAEKHKRHWHTNTLLSSQRTNPARTSLPGSALATLTPPAQGAKSVTTDSSPTPMDMNQRDRLGHSIRPERSAGRPLEAPGALPV